METLLKTIGAVVFVVVIIAGFSALMAYPTKWLVNYIFAPSAIQAVFGTAAVGFWKALFLNFFFGIAFKSFKSSFSFSKK